MSDKPLDTNIIRFDWAMKRLLRKKANFDILNGFLSVVLDQQVEIIELLECESNMDTLRSLPHRHRAPPPRPGLQRGQESLLHQHCNVLKKVD